MIGSCLTLGPMQLALIAWAPKNSYLQYFAIVGVAL